MYLLVHCIVIRSWFWGGGEGDCLCNVLQFVAGKCKE